MNLLMPLDVEKTRGVKEHCSIIIGASPHLNMLFVVIWTDVCLEMIVGYLLVWVQLARQGISVSSSYTDKLSSSILMSKRYRRNLNYYNNYNRSRREPI